MTTIKQGVFTGAAVFGFLKAWNGNRKTNKALRRKRKGKELTPEQGQLLAKYNGQLPEEIEVMQGFKTYTGIAVAAIGMVLGWLGVGETDSAALSAQIVGALDQVLTVGGLLFAAYGRAKAKPAT